MCKIEMSVKQDEFEIQITDNGRGFEVPSAGGPPRPTRGGRGGEGLKNMRQRLAEIGGECIIRSPVTKEGGTIVSMRIHLNGKPAE